jgi:DnaB-like helicase C terminal domain
MNPQLVGKSDDLEITPELRSIVDRVVNWESLEQGHFMRLVEEGRKGKNVGWGNGFERINRHLHGTHRGRYYLIGADSGVGKTTYADFSYVLEQYEYAKKHGKRWYCYYYSFELSKTEKIARWVSYYLYKKFSIIMPSNFILGRIAGNLPTEEDMKFIRAGYAYVEEMMEHIKFKEDAVHPTKIFMDMRKHYANFGLIKEGKKAPGKQYGPIEGYTPHPGHEDDMVTVVVDHIALLHSEQGMDTKQTIDLLSKYAVALRNLFGTSFVILQQFSTDMQSWHRSAKKVSDKFIAPQRLDFGDSKYTYRDADVVLGLVSPHQFELPKYFGYDVERLGGYMIGTHIMKNRYGTSSVMMPMFMNPLCGVLEELPSDNHELSLEEHFEMARKIEALCQKFSPRM